MKLYAYCVTKPDIRIDGLTGLSDNKVYSIARDQLAAFVSDFEGDVAAVSKKNVLAHEQVVRGVLEITTPLPFQFGIVVTELQLTSYLAARQTALLKNLFIVENCVEMSVKIIWQRPTVPEQPQSSVDQIEANLKQGAGAAFLQAKRNQILGDELLTARAKEIGSWLKSWVAPLARAVQITLRPGEKLVIAASCLVERSSLNSYNAVVERLQTERPELHFLTSGPWPPYSFANIDLEFKTHFGVS